MRIHVLQTEIAQVLERACVWGLQSVPDHRPFVLFQTLCILANIADGTTAKELIMTNDDILQKIKYYMVGLCPFHCSLLAAIRRLKTNCAEIKKGIDYSVTDPRNSLSSSRKTDKKALKFVPFWQYYHPFITPYPTFVVSWLPPPWLASEDLASWFSFSASKSLPSSQGFYPM